MSEKHFILRKVVSMPVPGVNLTGTGAMVTRVLHPNKAMPSGTLVSSAPEATKDFDGADVAAEVQHFQGSVVVTTENTGQEKSLEEIIQKLYKDFDNSMSNEEEKEKIVSLLIQNTKIAEEIEPIEPLARAESIAEQIIESCVDDWVKSLKTGLGLDPEDTVLSNKAPFLIEDINKFKKHVTRSLTLNLFHLLKEAYL